MAERAVSPTTCKDVTFRPLDERGRAATLWGARQVELPVGDLSGLEQTAWIRGVLLALFGPDTETSPDKRTFHYELQAIVDGSRELRLDLFDWKGAIAGTFGRFGTSTLDDDIARRVTDALLTLLETTPPADYEAKFFEYRVQRYGCAKGHPWVGAKSVGVPSCRPTPDSPFGRARARDYFRLDVPALASAAAPSASNVAVEPVTDAEVEAYYARNSAAGMPPLAAIREHVVRALLMERGPSSSAPATIAPVESRAIARAVFDLADLALYDFVPLARAFTWPFEPEALDAVLGLRKFEQLKARVSSGALSASLADADLERELLDDLDACVALLRKAARGGHSFQISRRVL